MQQERTPLRFVDSIWGRAAAYLMLLIWIASMAIVDSQAYSQAPILIATSILCILGLIALSLRLKFVQTPALSWVTLGVAAYMLVRAWTSYSVFEAYSDIGIILGCIVFYLAGISIAPTLRAGTTLIRVLCLAVILNIIFWIVMNKTEMSISILGRPEIGLAGEQSRHMSLFLYKNFAGAFFILGGALLIWFSIWSRRLSGIFYALIGIISLIFSFYCATRAVFFLIPVVTLIGWFLWFLLRIFTTGKISWFDGIFGLAFIIGLVMLIYDFFYGTGVMSFITGIDTHLRTEIWGLLLQVLPDAPLWGYGSGASQWEIAPLFNDWASPNYAHNEYFQLWTDYGIIALFATLILLLLHVIKGVILLTAEEPSHERRLVTAIAIFTLLGLAALSITDFVWHQYALATATAFCCGIIAAPVRRKHGNIFKQWLGQDRQWIREQMIEVKAQGTKGSILLALSLTLVLAMSVYESWVLTPQYTAQWTLNSQAKEFRPYTSEQYETILDRYPDYLILERYLIAHPVMERDAHAQRAKQYLAASLEKNPKNIYNLLHLVEMNNYLGHFTENEHLMRQHLPRGGSDPVLVVQPHVAYGLNIISQGLQALSENKPEKALSMLDYGLKIHQRQALYINNAYIKDAPKHLAGPQRPGLQELLKAATTQRDFLLGLGIQPDHQWKAPLPGEKQGALYQRYVKKIESAEKKSN